jgi:hypothetical protein
MSEFFVRKQHRRVGMGRDAATLIFDRFAGDWEIVEYLRNPGAVAFWRQVVAAIAAGRYTERSRHGEVQQRFKSRPRRCADRRTATAAHGIVQSTWSLPQVLRPARRGLGGRQFRNCSSMGIGRFPRRDRFGVSGVVNCEREFDEYSIAGPVRSRI